MPLRVERAATRADVRAFLAFPFAHYARDAAWVPPFLEERQRFLDPRRNPFFEHARCELFVARRGDAVVGTVAAVVDDHQEAAGAEQAASFGFFETVAEPAVATGLLAAAEEWARGQGRTVLRGPLNFSTNHECGLLVDGFDEPPMVMMTYNPPYYAELLDRCGYVKAMDLFAYVAPLEELQRNAPAKAFRAADRGASRAGIRVRPVDLRQFEHEVQRARHVYNQAWDANWGFVPMTDREFLHLANGLRHFLDPELIQLAETTAGEPVGIALALPDLNQPLLQAGGGRMFPFGVLKLLWFRRSMSQIRLMLLGVAKEYRGLGLETLLLDRTVAAARRRGYARMEGSWVLESNTRMNRICTLFGMQRYKTYRIYEKRLA